MAGDVVEGEAVHEDNTIATIIIIVEVAAAMAILWERHHQPISYTTSSLQLTGNHQALACQMVQGVSQWVEESQSLHPLPLAVSY